MRNFYLYCAVGMRGTGKTYTTYQLIHHYVKVHHRPVLIFDINREPIYQRLPPITQQMIERRLYSQGRIYRYNPKDYNCYDELTFILKNFKNACILLEDISRYLTQFHKREIVSTLVGLRHEKQDIIMHFQSYKDIMPKLRPYISVLRVHFTLENLSLHKNAFQEFNLMFIVDTIVKKRFYEGKRYNFLTINFDEMKIIGNITYSELDYALQRLKEVAKLEDHEISMYKNYLIQNIIRCS